MRRYIFVGVGLVLVFFLGCKKDTVKVVQHPYQLNIPSHFPAMKIPENNQMTVEGVALGRKLFYEKQLSGDGTMSCATCHNQNKSFSENKKVSVGIDGQEGQRNAMALINLGWQKFFFWDGRSKTLEQQILEPVPNPIEMNLPWQEAENRLNNSLEYQDLFNRAFGTKTIDSTLVAKAIAQFLRTLISGNSKFDVMYKYANNISLNAEEQSMYETITAEEWAGYDLFQDLNGADCFHCHNGSLMQVQRFSNNGLDETFTDLGLGEVTENPSDYGKFKIPTLRNIAFSAPYMHDGRFETLDEVIEQYSSGIHQSPTIDPLIEFAFQGGVQLDATQKDYLKKFLLTLNDSSFVNNKAFSNPN